jgi:hypothetical protein
MSYTRNLVGRITSTLVLTLIPAMLPASTPDTRPAEARPAASAAQPAPITGQWTIDWELGRRIENDNVQVIRASGVLTAKVVGDSLEATIDMKSRTDGRPATPPITLKGKASATGGVLFQVQQLRFNANGDERTVEVKVTWTLTANGDALTGEIVRDVPADMAPMGPVPPATITGTRVKG